MTTGDDHLQPGLPICSNTYNILGLLPQPIESNTPGSQLTDMPPLPRLIGSNTRDLNRRMDAPQDQDQHMADNQAATDTEATWTTSSFSERENPYTSADLYGYSSSTGTPQRYDHYSQQQYY